MTRINCIPVQELCRHHLVAEYRELPRVFKLAYKAINKGTAIAVPPTYTLGTGHVKFFYARLEYLSKRHEELVAEMKARGFKPQMENVGAEWKTKIEQIYWNDWKPSEQDMSINRARIEERKPKLKFVREDRGMCRRYYSFSRKLYCECELNNELYVCSKDGEPSHKVADSVEEFNKRLAK